MGLGALRPLRTEAVFDRTERRIAFRGVRFDRGWRLPFGNVIAVQVSGPIQHSDWPSYQLNLALAPGASKKDRINLLDNGGLDQLLFMGWKLAEFLDVPLLDHRALDESPQKDVKR